MTKTATRQYLRRGRDAIRAAEVALRTNDGALLLEAARELSGVAAAITEAATNDSNDHATTNEGER